MIKEIFIHLFVTLLLSVPLAFMLIYYDAILKAIGIGLPLCMLFYFYVVFRVYAHLDTVLNRMEYNRVR